MVTESAVWSTWTGVLAVEDEPAADGRSIEPGALDWPMMPVPLFRMDDNESQYVGTIHAISRSGGRLEASGRITGYPEGAVLAVHMHIDAQGVRPKDRGADPRRIHGGAIVGARLGDHRNWADAVIVVGAAIQPAGPAAAAEPIGVAGELRPAYPVVTPRLRMRPLTTADIPALLAYRGRADVCRYLPFEPMDAAVLTRRLAADLGTRAITAEGQSLTLGVELADSGRLIGDVVLFLRSSKHAGGELGYVFHPDVAGQGFATEACSAMLDLAFDPEQGLGLHRVIALMDARNSDSARLAGRLGLRQEAHHRSSEPFKGEWADLLIYAVLAEEWVSGAPAR